MNYDDSARLADFQWFLDNYMTLFKQYGHKVFAIQNKSILGVYNDKTVAIDFTTKKYPLGTFIVQECNGDESGYTFKAPPAMWM